MKYLSKFLILIALSSPSSANCDLDSLVVKEVKSYTPQLNTQNLSKELQAEVVTANFFKRHGFKLLSSKVNGNQGLDCVFQNKKSGMAIIHEAKFNANGGSLKLRDNKRLCDQMTLNWVKARIASMKQSDDKNVKKAASILAKFKPENIIRTANVYDGNKNTLYFMRVFIER